MAELRTSTIERVREGETAMIARLFLTGLLFLALLIGAPGKSFAQGRIALVVGNGAYSNVTALLNPPNDAADVS
jgi:hypothetical protein